jgi:hypothetical protein
MALKRTLVEAILIMGIACSVNAAGCGEARYNL